MDISTFAKHITEEEFHMISHINKDSGATLVRLVLSKIKVNVTTQYTNFCLTTGVLSYPA